MHIFFPIFTNKERKKPINNKHEHVEPQDSLRKNLKNLKKNRKKVEKERSKNGDLTVAPAPSPPLGS